LMSRPAESRAECAS